MSERIRYWSDWIVKNLAALLTIAGLLGFSAYKTNENLEKDDSILAITEHLHKMGSNETKAITKTIIIKKECAECTKQIKELQDINKKYHPE